MIISVSDTRLVDSGGRDAAKTSGGRRRCRRNYGGAR